MRAWAIALLAALGCGDSKEGWPAGRPRIDAFRMLGQSPGDPESLELELEFVDTDGDLGAGTMSLYIDGRSRSWLGLADVFAAQTPPLALTSTAGKLGVSARIDTSGLEFEVEFELAIDVQDQAGRPSNRPSLVLLMLAPDS